MFQEEVGDAGTPHLQGYVHYKNAVALSTLKAWNPRLHLEQTRSVVNSVAYCSDKTKRPPNGRVWSRGFDLPSGGPEPPLEDNELYLWQRSLMQELEGDPDDRTVVWYHDPDGGCGKTALAKCILVKFQSEVLYLSGGASKDILHQVVKAKKDPRIVIFNFPRTSEGKVSYAALETIKDGLVQSGKYEGGFRYFPIPHVIVFANWEPDRTALSADRWIIRHLQQPNQ